MCEQCQRKAAGIVPPPRDARCRWGLACHRSMAGADVGSFCTQAVVCLSPGIKDRPAQENKRTGQWQRRGEGLDAAVVMGRAWLVKG